MGEPRLPRHVQRLLVPELPVNRLRQLGLCSPGLWRSRSLGSHVRPAHPAALESCVYPELKLWYRRRQHLCERLQGAIRRLLQLVMLPLCEFNITTINHSGLNMLK